MLQKRIKIALEYFKRENSLMIVILMFHKMIMGFQEKHLKRWIYAVMCLCVRESSGKVYE